MADLASALLEIASGDASGVHHLSGNEVPSLHGPTSLIGMRDGLLRPRPPRPGKYHVHRDSVWAFAPANNEPGRLAQAILLARHCGDQELERAAVAKLRKRGEEPVAPWPDYLFRQAVADWAKQFSKATGIDLGDLAKLKRERPYYPEAL